MWTVVAAILAVVFSSLAAWRACQYVEQEWPFGRRVGKGGPEDWRWKQVRLARKRLQRCGAFLVPWNNTAGVFGDYVDFARWHGQPSDFANLEFSQYGNGPNVNAAYHCGEMLLSFKGSNFGDDQVRYLRHLKCIVDFTDTKVTDKGIAELKRDAPYVTIIRNAVEREAMARLPDRQWIRRLPAYAKLAIEIDASDARDPLHKRVTSPIEVLSGTTFMIDGQKFKLLGVEDFDDPAIRIAARDFATTWVASSNDDVTVVNGWQPLRLEDGTSLIWLQDTSHSGTCLNEELVRAGLVRVDHSKWEDYAFLGGPCWTFEAWQERLDLATAIPFEKERAHATERIAE
jgi:hypothetical protein